MGFSLHRIIQIGSILGASFGLVIGVIQLTSSTIATFAAPLYLTFFSGLLLFVEIYIFSCFKYFGFLLKNWGKALSYFLLGFLVYGPNNTLYTISGVIFFILAVFYGIFSFTTDGIAPPLLMGDAKVDLATSSADYAMVVV